MSLILSELATIEQIENVQTPDAIGAHYPIPHIDVYHRVRDTIDRHGFQVLEINHSLNWNHQQYYCVMRIQDTEHKSLLVGARNAHDKTCAASVIGGALLKVCTNGWFFGEYKFSRKHTRYLSRDLDGHITEAIAHLAIGKQQDDDRELVYRDTRLAKRDADHLLIESLRARALPASKIPEVLQVYERPPHAEYGTENLWTLFQAYTELGKSMQVNTLQRRTIKLQGLFDAYAMQRASTIDVVAERN